MFDKGQEQSSALSATALIITSSLDHVTSCDIMLFMEL